MYNRQLLMQLPINVSPHPTGDRANYIGSLNLFMFHLNLTVRSNISDLTIRSNISDCSN